MVFYYFYGIIQLKNQAWSEEKQQLRKKAIPLFDPSDERQIPPAEKGEQTHPARTAPRALPRFFSDGEPCASTRLLTNQEMVTVFISRCRESGASLRLSQLIAETGLPESLATYYIRKAVKQGLLQRIGRGVYRCL